MINPKIGIQLYTLRDYCRDAENFDKTLAYLHSLGVNVIQISGVGPISPEDTQSIVNKYDMDVCVTHKDFTRMRNDLDAMITEHKMINCDCMGIGSMPTEYRDSADSVREFIKIASEIGKTMLKNGEHFCYHNHSFEFVKVDGDRTIMDILIEESDPELFCFIPDVMWMHYAGIDPAEFLKRMQGRVKVLHFKDYILIPDGKQFVSLGEGRVDLKACYRACQELDIPYIVYEQDIDWVNNDALLATKQSWEYMCKIKAELDK